MRQIDSGIHDAYFDAYTGIGRASDLIPSIGDFLQRKGVVEIQLVALHRIDALDAGNGSELGRAGIRKLDEHHVRDGGGFAGDSSAFCRQRLAHASVFLIECGDAGLESGIGEVRPMAETDGISSRGFTGQFQDVAIGNDLSKSREGQDREGEDRYSETFHNCG